jgi:hypothetical protein
MTRYLLSTPACRVGTLVALSATVAFLGLVVCQSVHAAKYVSKQGYKITIPSGFVKMPEKGTDMLFVGSATDGTSPTIGVRVVTMAPDEEHKDLLADIKSAVKDSTKGFKLINEYSGKLAGCTFAEITYSYWDDNRGKTYCDRRGFIIRGNKLYAITCSDGRQHFPKVAGIFQKAIKSFTWTK